ncbi:MAG: ArnT family glycosyltransferase [Candidatus Binatia bacterium]
MSAERKYLFGILSLALALRAITLARIDPVAFDSALYFEIAGLIQTSRWAEAMAYPFPPLYPALIAALASAGMIPDAAGLVVSFSTGVLIMFPLLSLTRALAGERAALWAAFLWAIHPYAIRLSVRALSDMPAAFLVALSLWAGLRGLQSGRYGWAIGAGALSGLAYLTRPEGIESALGLAALSAFTLASSLGKRGLSNGFRPFLRQAGWVVAPLLGWAVVAAPYVAFISLEAGAITFSKKKSPAAMVRSITPGDKIETAGFRSTSSQEGASAKITESLPDAAEIPKTGWVQRTARNIYVFQQPFLNGIHLIILLPALLAPWLLRTNRTSEQAGIAGLLLGLTLLHLIVLVGVAALQGAVYLGGHHVFLMVLYLTPFAGAGLAAAFDRASTKAPGARWAPAATAALLIAVTLPSSVFRRPESGKVFRTAGLWIRDHSAAPPTVITNSPKLAYHAGARRVPLSGDAKSIVDLARRTGADFIAFEPGSTGAPSGDFHGQVESGALEVAETFSERSRSKVYTVVVYRVRQAVRGER